MKKLLMVLMILSLFILVGCTGQYRTVTFDSNGGTPVEAIKVKYGNTIDEPQAPVKEGSEFEGWFLDGEKFSFDKKIVSNITLVAKWDDNELSFTVTFVDYDGSILKIETVSSGQSATAPSDPSREGYVFTGWSNSFTNVTCNLEIEAQYILEDELTNTYTVIFEDYDGTELKKEIVNEGEDATAPSNPSREGYTFKGWDISYSNVTSDLVVKALYSKNESTTFTVIFYDYDGTALKKELVEKGKDATPPKDPVRDGYVFKGWSGNYTNVQANISIRASYISKTTSYNIIYNLNGGSFGYNSKDEYVLAFLNDFYEFVGPSEDLNTFIHGSGENQFMGTWKEYIGGSVGTENKLLYDNNETLDNESYFFNCKKYKAKWNNLAEWVKAQNHRFCGSGGYEYGALDFYRYIIDDPDQYINIYGEKFHSYPTLNEPTKLTYTYSENAIALQIPLNKTFTGWYLDSDCSGKPIYEIPAENVGDFEVYAGWDNTVTYEIYFNTNGAGSIDPITVHMNEEITLPTNLTKTDYTFLGWYFNGTYISSPFKFTYPYSITLQAKWKSNTVHLENLEYNGTAVKYRNSSTVVQIPSDYIQPKTQLRATWMSSYAATFSPSPVEATMKANLLKELEYMEKYNMNCMIFHIRTTNNAFYKTDLAPIDSNYGTYTSFDNFDYLEWLIEECHKRDIEFHAWLNPYRIKSSGYAAGTTASDVANTYSNYPKNPASKADNILMTYSNGAILNPCKEEVQDYIVDVCIEVMENYDVDAIHFDDYFYAQMSEGITVLTEPDQDDYEAFINANPSCGYSKTSATNKKQWRRDNIDDFIEKLSIAMTEFNIENGRGVQLGISPTGIYRNGNGTVSSGSNTAGQEHYSSYLFCDTVNWINKEWIDYIMPQSYWAFTHSVAGYADVMDWWNNVVEGKNVNLYSGLGLYMSVSGGNYSWGAQKYEIANQILYTTKLKNVKGVSIYSFKSLKEVHDSSSIISHDGLMKVKNEYWIEKVPTPETKASQYIK